MQYKIINHTLFFPCIINYQWNISIMYQISIHNRLSMYHNWLCTKFSIHNRLCHRHNRLCHKYNQLWVCVFHFLCRVILVALLRVYMLFSLYKWLILWCLRCVGWLEARECELSTCVFVIACLRFVAFVLEVVDVRCVGDIGLIIL